MPLFPWDAVRKEQMNPKFWRKVVHGEKLTVAQIYLAKGAVVPIHHHENEQMSYVLEGALKFNLDGKEVTVQKDQLLHIPPNVPHGVEALEDTFDIEIFAPVRADWLTGQDSYLRQG